MPQHLQVFRSQTILQSLLVSLLFWASMSAFAQQKKNSSPLSFLKNSDVSAGIFGQFTSRVLNMKNTLPVAQSTNASAGALFSFHKSYYWWLGYDANYGYTRFSEQYREPGGFIVCSNVIGPGGIPPCYGSSSASANVPTGMNEFTAAYLVKPPISLLGLKPYGEAGLGELLFVPTAGETTLTYQPPLPAKPPNVLVPEPQFLNVSTQHRLAGLYAIGVDAPLLTSHLGARFEYRNLWYTAPSFGDHYILDSNHSVLTQEPVASLYFKF